MTSIADSSAFRDDHRLLPQHQAVLTLLQGWLSDPTVEQLRWLDLACGRGQILTGLRGGLSPGARGKVDYVAYDMRHDHAKDTDQLASSLGFRSHHHKVGYLVDFPKFQSHDHPYDLITLTNTVHEVYPEELASVLVASIKCLSPRGCLFIYDMESLRPPELGAVPWTSGEINKLLSVLFSALGVSGYEPAVGQWRHRTCDAWNVQIYRHHLGLTDADLAARLTCARDDTASMIAELLVAKLDQCKRALHKLTEYGAETADEQGEKEKLLYEYWALSRALETGS